MDIWDAGVHELSHMVRVFQVIKDAQILLPGACGQRPHGQQPALGQRVSSSDQRGLTMERRLMRAQVDTVMSGSLPLYYLCFFPHFRSAALTPFLTLGRSTIGCANGFAAW